MSRLCNQFSNVNAAYDSSPIMGHASLADTDEVAISKEPAFRSPHSIMLDDLLRTYGDGPFRVVERVNLVDREDLCCCKGNAACLPLEALVEV